MNQTNLRRLIEHLKQVPDRRFNMEHFVIRGNRLAQNVADVAPYHKCESHGCIAGHILMAFRDEVDESSSTLSGAAADWLGIDSIESADLFLGMWTDELPIGQITRQRAIQHLESLVAD